ncbi:hypothetical protein M8998_07585 [Sphingobacterium sp. lm-10]|uniref:YiiX/YebB-like N1pC/P60 family cysteine hydrolase n=1 Tax=Sphingobacterium sp. lm-10 TaxID=2944904 RepID=UPI0020201564|nr:YiiX/YebB-like N1pC/P60 family cysteine hydrolase [Sphingobacterium sp. lm-10]MCL7987797.1 hypothetical protein [Sphingobacterium sp. lm-10]
MITIKKGTFRTLLCYFGMYITIIQIAFAQSKTLPRVPDIEFHNGDLLFVGASTANLSGAIDRVTQTSAKTALDHVAIIEVSSDSIFILHANTRAGSVRELLSDFLIDQKDRQQHYSVYRLQPDYQQAIPNALLQAKKLLGRPYNHTYILNDDSLYCSDFIERIFRADHIFELEPMTFKNPETQQLDTFWKSYYQKLQIDVPEGLPGCNPNGMAASDKLDYIGQW